MGQIKSRAPIILSLAAILLAAAALLYAAPQQTKLGAFVTACHYEIGGAGLTAENGCLVEVKSGATLQTDSGATETHGNAPTFNSNVTIAGTLDFANTGNLRPSSGVTNTFGNFYLINTIARTDTSNKTIGVLPANVQIADVTIYFSTASNAGTTATISCGKTGATPTEYVNAADVKAGAILQRGGASATMPVANYGGVGASAVPVFCKYAETGTASTTGGPFTVIVDYAN